MLQPETTTDSVPSASTPGPGAPALGVVFSFPAGSVSGAAEQAGGAPACLSPRGSAGVQAASAPLLSRSAALGTAGSCPLPPPWLARGPGASSFAVFPAHSGFRLGSGGCSSNLGPSFSSTLPSASSPWALPPPPLTAVSSTCNEKGEGVPQSRASGSQRSRRDPLPIPPQDTEAEAANSSCRTRALLCLPARRTPPSRRSPREPSGQVLHQGKAVSDPDTHARRSPRKGCC